VTKRKLQRFAETATFPNFFQPTLEEVIHGFRLKGNWAQDYFHNNHPLFIELGCGKGEYTIGLARKYPLNNYIGIDIKGARMWRGAKTALEENQDNAAFLRTQIGMIDKLFGEGEVHGLWITFPDPQPQHSRGSKRLTSPRFLKFYSKILAPGAIIHLKTDNTGLFEYTLNIIEQDGHQLLYATRDVYSEPAKDEAAEIQTFYERIWLEQGMKINYLRFILNPDDKT
jgi:tRNA (guanine-N7-)-methyltransferase